MLHESLRLNLLNPSGLENSYVKCCRALIENIEYLQFENVDVSVTWEF